MISAPKKVYLIRNKLLSSDINIIFAEHIQVRQWKMSIGDCYKCSLYDKMLPNTRFCLGINWYEPKTSLNIIITYETQAFKHLIRTNNITTTPKNLILHIYRVKMLAKQHQSAAFQR